MEQVAGRLRQWAGARIAAVHAGVFDRTTERSGHARIFRMFFDECESVLV
jgi:hypothetical protein